MYKKLFLVVVAVMFMSAFSAKSISAQQTYDPQITGGYGDVEVTSKEVKSAAKFAVKQNNKNSKKTAKIVSILTAQRQVVAGLNYMMCIKVRENGKIRTVTTVVYLNLKQIYSLSSWAVGSCKM